MTTRVTRYGAHALAAAFVAASACGGSGHAAADGFPADTLWMSAAVPVEHVEGARLFDEHCGACHGRAASGTDRGPPLVHAFYAPGHHADAAFHLAVARGVRAHHWRFGDMAPIPGLPGSDVERIVGYVRWLQREAGIR